MKSSIVVKVLIVASVCAIAGSVLAQTGEVYSLNVVGFQKVAARTSGLSMVAAPFYRQTNTIDAVVGAQLQAGKSESVADRILIWNPTNQAYTRYWLKASDSNWYTAGLVPVRATNAWITSDMGFWVESRATNVNEVMVLSGDVVDDMAVTSRLIPGLNLITFPYNASVDVNACNLTNGAAGKSESVSDRIIIWDATNQVYLRYWLKNTDRKWYTGGLVPVKSTGVTVGAGSGFWYQNFTNTIYYWVEARPYSL